MINDLEEEKVLTTNRTASEYAIEYVEKNKIVTC